MRVVPDFALFRRGLIDGGDWRLLCGGVHIHPSQPHP
jgi:hypothetical protein